MPAEPPHPAVHTAARPGRVSARADPWAWRPSIGGWCDALRAALPSWRPSDGVELEPRPLLELVDEAAATREEWLLHPALASLTLPAPTAHNDLQLALWAEAHTDAGLGSISLPNPGWVWTPEGGFPVQDGRHALAELADRARAASDAPPIALDVWSDSVGFPSPAGYPPPEQCWSGARPLSAADDELVREGIVGYLRAVAVLFALFPGCAAWVRAVTPVVIALRGENDGSFGSGSLAELPGVVYVDLAAGERYILEGLVHESAHRHLYLADAEAALVDPAHVELYSSPLRPEPRPLRGILLAYHALAYMCAFYAEWHAVKLPGQPEEELEDLRRKCRDARETLELARHGLTAAGREFLDLTTEVAAHDA
jgi:HEXXH motif-containing protein